MGSLSRSSALERFANEFGERLEQHFQYLIGLEVKSLTDVEVDHYVKGQVHLSNGESLPVHYRWSGEEEDAEGKELDEHFKTIADHYSEYIIGKTVVKVEIGASTRDDELYILAIISDEAELEIPLGYDPENREIGGLLDNILSEEVIAEFHSREER